MKAGIFWSRLLPLLAALLGIACAHSPKSVATDPTPLRKAMARQALSERDWASALELLAGLYQKSPEDAEVLTMRGIALRESGLLREAETELSEAVRLDPARAAAHSALAVLLDQQARSEEALPHHKRASELEPRNPSYLNNLSFALFARGKTAEAIEGYLKALRLAPNDARIRNNLGFAYARSRDFAGAEEQFRHAGPPPRARNNLGFAYELEGNLGQAFELYVESARLEPAWPVPRRNLARVARVLGRPIPGDILALEGPPSGKEGER